MIKYLGSKRRLVPVLEQLATRSGARTALDLFTGTTRVAQAYKALGLQVTAVDSARYSEVFGRCYVEADATAIDRSELDEAVRRLDRLKGRPGYVTETFCEQARFFQPFNGARIDAIRETIARDYARTWLEPILLTSLIEAADRVDSTIGVQMAYVKAWAPRSFRPLELRVPELLAGTGRMVHGDAQTLAPTLGPHDLAYLDPPYNQHRYYTNYHVWETLVAWDAPAHYGVACKRVDARDASTKSVFNSKRTMPTALGLTIRSLEAPLVILSYNDESWMGLDELVGLCEGYQAVTALEFDSARYVGARTGIHSPTGERVGTVSHLRNREYLILAGERSTLRRLAAGLGEAVSLRGRRRAPGSGAQDDSREVMAQLVR